MPSPKLKSVSKLSRINMDENVEQKPSKIKASQLSDQKLKISDFDLEDFKKNSHLVSPPLHQQPRLTRKSSSGRSNCLCSPTTHAGSFRCRHHRNAGLSRGGSVGSNLSALASKTGSISDSLSAQ
ncbi:hypothetical protein L6164_030969 [Bauhinia variegata]|uniref:Uncharacterized protein n=1 Tax=Bauhinia variegata TaxID=167791 RepID=A0ACB9LE53_BAUVA|nr:hypothetical protein L6164_030969 [Bauhinia variegata]